MGPELFVPDIYYPPEIMPLASRRPQARTQRSPGRGRKHYPRLTCPEEQGGPTAPNSPTNSASWLTPSSLSTSQSMKGSPTTTVLNMSRARPPAGPGPSGGRLAIRGRYMHRSRNLTNHHVKARRCPRGARSARRGRRPPHLVGASTSSHTGRNDLSRVCRSHSPFREAPLAHAEASASAKKAGLSTTIPKSHSESPRFDLI